MTVPEDGSSEKYINKYIQLVMPIQQYKISKLNK